MPLSLTLDLESRLAQERRQLILLGVICLALVGGALYLQFFKGEDPCPLCILQRYGYLFIALFAFIGAAWRCRRARAVLKALILIAAAGGATAAGRHVMVLSKPMFSCGFDALEPIVDALPPAHILPSVFKVSGLCETAYPPILGMSLPAWSLIGFVLIFVLVGRSLLRRQG